MQKTPQRLQITCPVASLCEKDFPFKQLDHELVSHRIILSPVLPDILCTAFPLSPPPDTFLDPFADKPWYWKTAFVIYRGFRLCVLFAPIVAYTLAVNILPLPDHMRDQLPERLVSALEEAGCAFQKIGEKCVCVHVRLYLNTSVTYTSVTYIHKRYLHKCVSVWPLLFEYAPYLHKHYLHKCVCVCPLLF
jgi:hypothetical protein